VCAAVIVASPETVARARGAIASLRPQIRVPRAARRLPPAASATFVATWALGGFYQAFGPSVAAEQLGTCSALIAAVVFAPLMAPSAIGAPLAGRTTPANAQRIGMGIYLGAVLVILVSLHGGDVVPFIAASAVAGAAQGATFAGSMRALLAKAGPADRAGILAAIYLLSNSGAAIPNLIAGQLSLAQPVRHRTGLRRPHRRRLRHHGRRDTRGADPRPRGRSAAGHARNALTSAATWIADAVPPQPSR
jgi:hypothetical protein